MLRVRNTLKDYQSGLTPNPDMMCNAAIKFNRFFEYCRNELNVDAISTGHYVRSSYGCYLENYNPDKRKLVLYFTCCAGFISIV